MFYKGLQIRIVVTLRDANNDWDHKKDFGGAVNVHYLVYVIFT
jgi:hypothetical protein